MRVPVPEPETDTEPEHKTFGSPRRMKRNWCTSSPHSLLQQNNDELYKQPSHIPKSNSKWIYIKQQLNYIRHLDRDANRLMWDTRFCSKWEPVSTSNSLPGSRMFSGTSKCRPVDSGHQSIGLRTKSCTSLCHRSRAQRRREHRASVPSSPSS